VSHADESPHAAAPAKRARFADLLGPALAGPVQVVGTLRPDTIERMLAKSDLELGLEALGVKPP
jgi:hypothetical protein